MTKEQIEKFKTNIEATQATVKVMQAIAKATKDDKERYYYYGQIDGILGFLEMLGVEINN